MNTKFVSTIFVLCAFFVSCKDVQENGVTVTAGQIQMLRTLGFNPDGAVLLDDGRLLVEQDILITPAGLENLYQNRQEYLESEYATDRQRIVAKSATVPFFSVANLTYSIDAGFTPEQIAGIRAGIIMWSNGKTNIALSEVPSTSLPNIIIYVNNNLGANRWGQTAFPSGGPISAAIAINIEETIQDCTVDIAQCLKILTAHELGHALGFRHTDEQASQLLYGSPQSDPGSIMNSGDAIGGMAGYGTLPGPNDNDTDMASALYPKIGLAVELLNVQVSPSMGGDFVTMDVSYRQNYGICHTVIFELLRNNQVIKTFQPQDIGVIKTGKIYLGKFLVEPGRYQVRAVGRNYKGDFTQPVYSNYLSFSI